MLETAKNVLKNKLGDEAVMLFESLMSQELKPSDAIVYLQGDRLDRLPKVRDLYLARYAPKVYLTGNNAMMERRAANGENDMYLDELVIALKNEGVPQSDTIVDSEAMNTPDQAMHAIAEAKRRGWQKLIIVTSPYHVLRSYLTFVKQAKAQEWDGMLIMAPIESHWDIVPSGRSKTALQMLEEETEKITHYQKDCASLTEARAFLERKPDSED